MTTTEQRPSSEYKVVGTRPIRHDGIDKVTGAAKYGADIQLAGMLHGKVLRSPYAHARIRNIDTSRAEALPGVMAVLTASDFPIIQDQVIDLAETQGNIRLMAEHVMANEKALYQGHAVAAVAATSPHIAEQALALIDIDYEVLEPILSLEHAMRPDAPSSTRPCPPTSSRSASPAARTPAPGATLPATSSTSWAMSKGDSGKPMSFWSASTTPERCTRATSNPTPPPPPGPATGA